MNETFEPVTLGDHCPMTVNFRRWPGDKYHGSILLVVVSGPYDEEAERDALRISYRYVAGMISAGLARFEPSGVVLDFTAVEYRNGDRLTYCMLQARNPVTDSALPQAVVVSSRLREALHDKLADLEEHVWGQKIIVDSIDAAVDIVKPRILRLGYRLIGGKIQYSPENASGVISNLADQVQGLRNNLKTN